MEHELDEAGRRLLTFLVGKLPGAVPNDPRTFVGYKLVHDELDLPRLGPWGKSLEHQGLASLAGWLFRSGKPAITGLVVDTDSLLPGEGYFRVYGFEHNNLRLRWWRDQIEAAKNYDWSPHIALPVAVAGDKTKTFQVGHTYRRADVRAFLGLSPEIGGAWSTGYVQHDGQHFIFCGIDVPGRTGHDYQNHFIGDDLLWSGRTESRLSHPSIQALVSHDAIVRIFYRTDERAPFVYAGQARAIQTWDESPVRVKWSFADDPEPHPENVSGEIGPGEKVLEGARKSVLVNVYERDPDARRRCIDRWKCCCVVCGFDFERAYGALGKGFIHVHHLKPLSEIGQEYQLDPEQDLRPVCPNCHAMLHRRKPALSISELAQLLRKQGSD